MAKYEPHDKFYRKAREQGLPSRAAFKISELIARFKLVRAGARVADLGCAPGGWLAILALAAGATGRVVGVDLAACKVHAANVVTIAGDICDPAVRAVVVERLGGAADLVTSDLAPKLSGIAERDQARSLELLAAALDFAAAALRPRGAMAAKLFMGPDFNHVAASFKQRFAQVEIVRVKATRPGSSELYVVARGFRPAAFAAPQ
ncbi:MAG: SAM-dependent methyltransferase [Candidatus Binataceae bacterium]